jgi:DNA-binding protein YbaB
VPETPTEKILQARDEADKLGQVVEAASEELGPVTEYDPSRMVEVKLDPQGVVESVKVEASWRDRLELEELAPAVIVAYNTAGAQRTAEWAEAFARHDDATPVPRSRPLPTSDFTERMIAAAGGQVSDKAVVEVVGLMGRLDDAMAEVEARMEAMAAAEYVGRSSSKHVKATCHVSGELRSLDINLKWLTGAHSFNIGREITEAVRNGHARATEKSLKSALDDSPLGELQALLDDPEALGRALREHSA